MIASFTDEQFAVLQRIAGNLPVEQRAAFIEKTAEYIRLHGDYDDAVDVVELAVDLALRERRAIGTIEVGGVGRPR